ncbi:tyrosine-type recombinase/integrase [Cohnella mopanensis]|uniref:tyrosine-type recombinase/integrase n=1 Tax=Cohnella mopanensis TaxID=2911966 RepID=UPI001EF8BB0F
MDKRIGKRYKFDRSTRNIDKSLHDLFDIFYSAKAAEGRSPNTLEKYREYFRYFCLYLKDANLEPTMTCVTPVVVRNYMNWMRHEKRKWDGHAHKVEANMTVGLSPATINSKVNRLRTMFQFLLNEGHITTNPLANVGQLKESVKPKRVLTVNELQALMAAPNRKSYAGFRDYTAINLILDTMGRISEVIALKESDIDFKAGTVYFREEIVKTRVGRRVPITKRTSRLLKELINENKEFDTDFIFLANYGMNITHDQFRNRLKQHAKSANLDGVRIHPHLLRHTGATMFLENGGELRHLASLLGHNDLRSVLQYTHLSDQALRFQHDLYSPLNQIIPKLQLNRKTKRK